MKKRRICMDDLSQNWIQTDYRKYHFDGNIEKNISPFKIIQTKYYQFGNITIHLDMNIKEIMYELGNKIEIDSLIEHHNDYYKLCNIEKISKEKLDARLLLSMIRQKICYKCTQKSTNIWCKLCGTWSHSHCESDLDQEALNFICQACQSS